MNTKRDAMNALEAARAKSARELARERLAKLEKKIEGESSEEARKLAEAIQALIDGYGRDKLGS